VGEIGNRVYSIELKRAISVSLKNVPFEVEFRCRFDNPENACEALPFMRSCLNQRMPWSGTFYGRKLFESGKLLRISEIANGINIEYHLTWKGPDTGKFANIRLEISEDITSGINNSSVLNSLGGKGRFQNKDEVIRELESLGYHPFMSWNGIDLFGFYEPYGINVKLMNCEFIKWPWLVELEKMASTAEEASRCEAELEKLSHQFKLSRYIVKQEPPDLLFERVFGQLPESG
jgi:adenylate cyclase class IV